MMVEGKRRSCDWGSCAAAVAFLVASAACLPHIIRRIAGPPKAEVVPSELSFSVGGIRQTPSCQPSDDSAFECKLSSFPGSFADEVEVYLAIGDKMLSAKIVVSDNPASHSLKAVGKTKIAWVSLGLSPNGRMAGPSEAIVGFHSAEDVQGEHVASKGALLLR